MSIYREIYKPYNELLIKEVGIDWFTMNEWAGLYPDTALLLIELAKLPDVKTILELGSGASTIWLQAIATKLDKKFYSVEEIPKWFNNTIEKMGKYSVTTDNVFLEGSLDYSKIPAPDLIFLDSGSDNRPTILNTLSNKNWIAANTKYLVVDDAEAGAYARPIYQWLHKNERYNTQIVNLVGREDRSQMINCLDDNFHIYNWIWNWRPDKKYW